ncbi:LPP20 family lipoprotein [Ferrimonas balearica]|uniref:LPP20 family lipoprotein n=1 Tax=Ferrimonas balearica TaxID=44012 RepID=UPI001F3EA817|nr:LPP20 family lipoprotein [Ferrimonas balearica]MBY6094941.1 LPP20 family lipoprotein [Ferrimonas balearica]
MVWVGLGSCASTQAPTWYQNQTHQQDEQYYWGYGSGSSREQARSAALTEIALQLRAEVHSDQSTLVTVDGEQVAQRIRSEQQVQTQLQLQGAQLVEHQHSGGQHWLLMRYSRLSLAGRIRQGQYRCDPNPQRLIYSLPVYQQLAEELGCVPASRLAHDAAGWSVVVAGQPHYLPPWQPISWFPSQLNPGLTLSTQPTELAYHRPYFVRIDSGESGYLSLYQLGPDGAFQQLLENQPVEADTPWLYPDASRYHGLMLEPARDGGEAELLLAARCDAPQAGGAGQRINNDHQLADNRHQLPALLQRFDQCAVSTLVLSAP